MPRAWKSCDSLLEALVVLVEVLPVEEVEVAVAVEAAVEAAVVLAVEAVLDEEVLASSADRSEVLDDDDLEW